MLRGWCWFAAALLIVSLAVHGTTFLGMDPLAKCPGVMFIHLAIFAPFAAALCYARRTAGQGQGTVDPVVNSAPRWLRALAEVRRREGSGRWPEP